MKNAFPAMHCHCFKDISLKSQRRMMQDASRGKWYNLVRLRDIPAFAMAFSCTPYEADAAEKQKRSIVKAVKVFSWACGHGLPVHDASRGQRGHS